MEEPILGGYAVIESPGKVEGEIITSIQNDRVKTVNYWLFKEDGEWTIPGKEFPYLITFTPRISLTNIPELDYSLLRAMKYEEVLNICQANQYLSQICRDDLFWKEKIRADYPGMLELHMPDESYRTQYEVLHKKNPIEAIQKGQLYLLIYLKSTGFVFDQKLALEAAAYGRLEILDWLVKNGITVTADMLPLAIANGHLEVAKYITNNGHFPLEEDYDMVIGEVQIDFMEKIADWMYGLGVTPSVVQIYNSAIKEKIYFLEWLKGKGHMFPQFLIDRIVFDSNGRAIQWLLDNQMPPTQDTLDATIWLNKIATLAIFENYGYAIGPVGYLYSIFANNIIMFRKMLRKQTPIYQAMNKYIILIEHPHFFREYDEFFEPDERLCAELVGHPETKQFVFSKSHQYTDEMIEVMEGRYPSGRPIPFYADLAMAYGHSELVKEFIKVGIYPTDTGYIGAIVKDYSWAIELMNSLNYHPGEIVLFASLHYKRIDMFKRMIENGVPLTTLIIDIAAAYGETDLLKWIDEKFMILPTMVGSTLAMQRGHYNTVEFILESDTSLEPTLDSYLAPIIWNEFPRKKFLEELLKKNDQ